MDLPEMPDDLRMRTEHLRSSPEQGAGARGPAAGGRVRQLGCGGKRQKLAGGPSLPRTSPGSGTQDDQDLGLAAPVTPVSLFGGWRAPQSSWPCWGQAAFLTPDQVELVDIQGSSAFLGGSSCACSRAQIVVSRHSSANDTAAGSTSGGVLLTVENRVNAWTEPDVNAQLVPSRLLHCVRAGHLEQ